MTRTELGEAAAEEWRPPASPRLDLVEMNVAFLYRLMCAVYLEVDVTGPVTATNHVVGPLDAPGVVLTNRCRAGCQQLSAQASKVNQIISGFVADADTAIYSASAVKRAVVGWRLERQDISVRLNSATVPVVE